MILSNKLALVTGAGSGIGASIARIFAKNGANLVLVDIDPSVVDIASQIEAEYKIKAVSHKCDVSNSEEVNNLFSEIRSDLFPEMCVPNVLVNSAGITRDSLLVKMSEKEFDQVIRVNLKGTWIMTQAAARGLSENLTSSNLNLASMRTYGSFINMASVVGKFGNIGQSNYAASKAGVEGLTRTTAKELGKLKIRCYSILPGFIKLGF